MSPPSLETQLREWFVRKFGYEARPYPDDDTWQNILEVARIGAEHERTECARLVDEQQLYFDDDGSVLQSTIAEWIRARGAKP